MEERCHDYDFVTRIVRYVFSARCHLMLCCDVAWVVVIVECFEKQSSNQPKKLSSCPPSMCLIIHVYLFLYLFVATPTIFITSTTEYLNRVIFTFILISHIIIGIIRRSTSHRLFSLSRSLSSRSID